MVKTLFTRTLNNLSESQPEIDLISKSIKLPSLNKENRILLVDDEAFNIMAHRVILGEAETSIIKEICNQKFGSGHNHLLPDSSIENIVDVCKNGQEALKAIKDAFYSREYQYFLILTDLSMPIMDGFESSLHIRRFLRRNSLLQPLIVACTGHVQEEWIQKAWIHQIDEVIAKPVGVESLKAVLKETIEYRIKTGEGD